ncbi:MAG: mechanosensitive ion channel family protein [candidate division Zixibacteria bacterium]|nr:mechanosensitive ion channel family protein [candidate division Zixibacteria bacterium]
MIGLSAIVLATLLIAWLVRAVLFVLARRLAAQTRTDLDDRLLSACRKPVYYLVYLIGLVALLNYLEEVSAGSVPAVFRYVDFALYAVGVILVARLIIGLAAAALAWYGENIAARTDTTVDDEFVPLIDRAIKVIVYVLSLLIILDHFGVDIKGLVAILGVGSLAIALAAQETIANMIGGFVIMIDRPFRVGDRVRLGDGTICIVNQIGIRSSKFRTFDNTLVIIPNADLMKSTVHNLTYPHPRLRVQIDVGVGYDSDMALVRRVMLEEAGLHPIVIDDPEPSFYFLEFGDSSLNVSMRCWVADVSQQFQAASELREQVLSRFRTEGIEIPFPQRVITMVPDSEKQTPAPSAPTSSAAIPTSGGCDFPDSADEGD